MEDSPSKKPKIALVCTTINDGKFLDAYADKVFQEGVEGEVIFIVIPDKKTPAAIYEKCKEIKTRGINAFCPAIEEQEAFLERLGTIKNIIPYDSDNRRNIGYLMALETRAETIISIDDDNYPLPAGSFFGEHSIIGKEFSGDILQSENKWLNICSSLKINPEGIYPRGFPYYARQETPKISSVAGTGVVHLNEGLWLGHPDVDAITCLADKPQSAEFSGKSFLLHQNSWSPINTQNTALHRDAMAAYYFFRMGHTTGGMRIDRYGDIFSGYFVQKCVKHLGYGIRFGTPIANHVRNTHNYLKDLTNELACILILEDMLPWLQEVKIDGGNYITAYLSLADALDGAVDKFSGLIWQKDTREYFHMISKYMHIWIDAVKKIEGT